MEYTQASVPVIHRDVTGQWVVMSMKGVPYGLLTEMAEGDAVEVGARLWKVSPAITLAAADWIDDCLDRYAVAVARVFSRNHRVKRLLQRGGFRLVRVERGVEFYAVTRDTYLGRRKEAGQHG